MESQPPASYVEKPVFRAGLHPAVESCLQQLAVESHKVTKILLCPQNIKLQLSLKYADYEIFHKICETEAFFMYMYECAQVCWDLCVQTPPMIIDCTETEYRDDLHKRFYDSNNLSPFILLYHWPTLLQTPSGPILARGVVQT